MSAKNNQNDVVTLLPIVVVVRRLNLSNPLSYNLSPPCLFLCTGKFLYGFKMLSYCSDKKGYLSVVIILLSFDDSIKTDHYLI